MLDLTCQIADVQDGQDILELGCGWGSLSLWMAEKYPASRITAVSNSTPQRGFIEAAASSPACEPASHHGGNESFSPSASASDARFDRIISVEMFSKWCNVDLLLSALPNGCDRKVSCLSIISAIGSGVIRSRR